MTSGAEQLKGELIDRVAARARQTLEPGRAPLVETFVRGAYAHVPPADLLREDVENLYGAALAFFTFAQSRVPGEAKVRVYNPHLEEQGWRSGHTIVEIVNEDMPFLVDSVTAALAGLDARVHLVIHPILEVERDDAGRLEAIVEAVSRASSASPAPAERMAAAGGGAQRLRESFMQIQVTEQPSERHGKIAAELERVLTDVRLAVSDWGAMRARLGEILDQLQTAPPPLARNEIEEGIDFLNWLDDDHFTFLGYREYAFEGRGAKALAQVVEDRGLGVLRDPEMSIFEGLRNLGGLPPEVRHFLRQPELLRITKSNRRATVHRPVHLDTVAVKTFDAEGKVSGERLFVGLFTSVAYSRSPRDIPLLRHKVNRLLNRSGFAPDSHDGKALLHILETYPRDELFQSSEDELFETALGILHLQERQRIALFARRDSFERFVSCLVYVPRDRFNTDLRLRFQEIIARAYEGEVTAFYTHLTDAALARLHVIIKTTPGRIPEVDTSVIEARLADAARSWVDHLEQALIESRGEDAGLAATRRFLRAFPASYQEDFRAEVAVFDIARVERLMTGADIAMNLYRPIEAEEDRLRLKIYHGQAPIPLSDVLPMLENMGLKVIAEHPYDLKPEGYDGAIWIHDFDMAVSGGAAVEVATLRETFHEAFARVWRGEMENDGFNRLVLAASLAWRDIVMLRAYCKYLRQAAIPFSQTYMGDTLARNPDLARLLVALFHARFDPSRDLQAAEAEEVRLRGEILAGLEKVENLDEDRIIRRFLNAIEATLRTNYYQPGENGGERPCLSFKFDSQALDELPLPRPLREIFVYSPRVEGVHLRFGLVARGGLRWSDRREDFRTEILGLVKAQQVKNAVIVPVGSKGGFVPKQLPAAGASREEIQAEGVACYQIFIGGLLDLTDNLVQGAVVPPEALRRHDGDDPYLVVAADKGTAAFSDIANAISQARGFWLDDAFASGGSAGYDHKAMGITARGAWESVKRHFRERGKDCQSEDFTCVGVGDMSGDVFGNGMLLSKQIKLIGAFNHLHIFLDPDPDPETSWAERKRLFEMGRSAWSDYNPELISKGGGVFDRKAKSIKLTPEIQAVLDLEAESATPNEVIRAILKADVELLWFGGIGTYVKDRAESHSEVGDRANDALRVDGQELRARIVGEGANLGMTQRGRIAYSLAGGRCNTDAMDNSAGVDCSDHEVNIKVLLGDVEASGDMTRKQRDQLLEAMTEEVARLVLRDNYLQTQAISVTEQLGVRLMDRTARFMHALERGGHLNRAIEFLPDDEAIAERRKAGIGMTRPELAVLLSYAKIVLYQELLETSLPDDPFLGADLEAYFPKPLQENYPERIARHRLRREIVATVVTNALVNRLGFTSVYELRERSGLPVEEVARACMVGQRVFGFDNLWAEIEALDAEVPARLQYELLLQCGRMMEQIATWLLRNAAGPIDIAAEIDRYQAGVTRLAEILPGLLEEADAAALAARAEGWTAEGAPRDLAGRMALLERLPPALDIVRIAALRQLPEDLVARVFVTSGARFGFDWLRQAAGQISTENAWDKLAVTAIVEDFYSHQSDLTLRVLDMLGEEEASDEAIEAAIGSWSDGRPSLVRRSEQLLTELRGAGQPDLAKLAVANRQLKAMVAN